MPMPSRGGRLAAALVLLAAVTTAGGVTPAVAAPTPSTTLTFYTLNDFHGRITSDSTDAQGRAIGGAAQIAGMLDALRDPDSALVLGGDDIGASSFASAVQDDTPTLDALSAMDVTASAVGNHEFDRGVDDLVHRVEPRARFPYLAANVYDATGARVFTPSVVRTIGGVRVGFVGVVTAKTPAATLPGNVAGLQFRDPVAEASTVATALKASGAADVVVLLAHEGAAASDDCAAVAQDATFRRFVTMTATVDAIVSGHTHERYGCVLPGPDGTPRPVVQAAKYGTDLGRVTLTWNSSTHRVTAATADVLPVVGYPEDPTVKGIVDRAVAESATLGERPVGRATGDLLRGYDAAGELDKGVESPLGDLVADAQLAATVAPGRGGAQLAMTNPGGLRADIPYAGSPTGGADGVVTYAEAALAQPFHNDVVTVSLTGRQVVDVLEQQWQPDGATRPLLHLATSDGFRYVYDPSAVRGHHVVPSSLTLHGAPMALTATFRVTVNAFLAEGGDGFTGFTVGRDRTTTGDDDLTALVDYLTAHSPVTPNTVPRWVVGGPATVPPTDGPTGTGATSPVPATAAPAAAAPELAATGADADALLATAGAALLAGLTSCVLARRRRRLH